VREQLTMKEAPMVDSSIVLYGQTIAYTLYCVMIILLMGWFALNVTRTGRGAPVRPVVFYSFVVFLAVLGVSLHLITYNTIPWAKVDLNRGDYKPDKTFTITVADHAFRLPSAKMVAVEGDLVLFDVKSEDLTYGFGLFRPDNSTGASFSRCQIRRTAPSRYALNRCAKDQDDHKRSRHSHQNKGQQPHRTIERHPRHS
jgi:hypothetical protein